MLIVNSYSLICFIYGKPYHKEVCHHAYQQCWNICYPIGDLRYIDEYPHQRHPHNEEVEHMGGYHSKKIAC